MDTQNYDCLELFTDFWIIVLSYFEEDPLCAERSFPLVCKKFNEIFKKNAFFTFKHFVLDPKRRSFGDIDFLIGWDGFLLGDNFRFDIINPNKTDVSGGFYCSPSETGIHRLLTCHRQFLPMIGASGVDYLEPSTLFWHSNSTECWEITDLDLFIQVHFPVIRQLPFSKDFSLTRKFLAIEDNDEPPAKRQKNEYNRVNIRMYFANNPSKKQLLALKSRLEGYNKVLNLWSSGSK